MFDDQFPITIPSKAQLLVLVETTLKEIVDAWPAGQAKTYLARKLVRVEMYRVGIEPGSVVDRSQLLPISTKSLMMAWERLEP